jgi:hypothetical protein
MVLLTSPLQRGYRKGMAINKIAMPLDPATRFAMVGSFLSIDSYTGNVHKVVVTACDLQTWNFFITFLVFAFTVQWYEFMVLVWIHGSFDGVDLSKYCR